MNIFTFLSSILSTKKHIEIDTENEKEFNLYMLNRWLSMYSPDTAALLNTTANKWWMIFDDKQQQYNFLFYLISRKSFKKINYLKKTAKAKKEKDDQQEQDLMAAHANFMSLKQYKELKNSICM